MARFMVLMVSACALTCSVADAGTEVLRGAGSTLSANYIDALRSDAEAVQGVSVRYDAVGSGEGIRRLAAGQVDFALTDVPLTEFELAQLRVAQLPLFYCGIVVVVNLPGLRDGELRLSDRAVSGIFEGRITRWRDPEVMRSNGGWNVPDLPIIVVHRADTSGTSYVFTSFLSQISEAWANRFGLGSRLSWPTGRAARGSAGEAAMVREQPGTIGYLEYGNALKDGLATAQLASGTGDFVRAGSESFRRALIVRPTERASHYQLLTRSPTAGAWPILATEYGLMAETRTTVQSAAAARFLRWVASSPVLAEFHFLPYGSAIAAADGE